MTLQDLKALNQLNGGHWFDTDAMARCGDTLKSYTDPVESDDGLTVTVTHKSDGKTWQFYKTNGRLGRYQPRVGNLTIADSLV